MHRPCMYPLNGYIKSYPDGTRKFKLSDNEYSPQDSEAIMVPCGKCFNCLMNKRMDWTVRLFHESLYHKYCYFITLTYSDKYIDDNKLNKRHCQLFFKRLRKVVDFRYFLCGEYGETNGRRHYHMIMYTDVDMLKDSVYMYSHNGVLHYSSPLLIEKWHYGFNDICVANLSSMRYVCGYVLKKLGRGDISDEFILTSRNPGIARQYIEENYRTAAHNGFCSIQGKLYSLPKYYWDYIKLTDSDLYANILSKRNPRQAYSSMSLSSIRAIASKVQRFKDGLSGFSFNNKL